MKKFFFPFFILIYLSCSSQASRMDTLLRAYSNKTLADSTRLKYVHDLAFMYVDSKPDSAIILAEEEIRLGKKFPAQAKMWEGRALITTGVAYKIKGNYPKALESYLMAMKLNEEVGDKRSLGNCYNNIGIIYNDQANYDKALEYYLKALPLYEQADHKPGISNCLNNIGLVYYNISDYPKALKYYSKYFSFVKEQNNKDGIATSYLNFGNVYSELGEYPKALSYLKKALQLNKEIGLKPGIELCYLNIGGLLNMMKDYKQSILYSDSAIKLSEELGDIYLGRIAYQDLADSYSADGDYKSAYLNHVKFKRLNDSIFNEENSRQLGDLRTKFEVEKREAELKIKAEAQEAITAEEKKEQRIIIYAAIGILIVVIFFSISLFSRFRVIQKQKQVIEEQKLLVDKAYESLHEKNTEVMDSINYARKIQAALITSEKYIHRTLEKLMKK